jgi:hypothetical protein
MILCFNIARKTKDNIDYLMGKGNYKDPSELLAVAIANQILLHESTEPDAHPVVLPSETEKIESSDIAPDKTRTSLSTTTTEQAIGPQVPSLFRLDLKRFEALSLASVPDDAFVDGMEIPADRWIWGQHNKLLPVKANLRALANIVGDGDKRGDASLERISAEISSSASQLGEFLRTLDSRLGGSRDEALAIAFPSLDSDNSDRSRLRYATQFVGTISKEGHITGLLFDLKLINFDHHKSQRIRLTQPGAEFAQLRNPVLDDPANRSGERFSEEERLFLLRHIMSSVPIESFAYRAILSKVQSGANTPAGLDRALEPYLPKRPDKPFSPAFLTTQRAGVVSRMSDLGLVKRIRDRANVTYAITPLAEQLLEGTV